LPPPGNIRPASGPRPGCEGFQKADLKMKMAQMHTVLNWSAIVLWFASGLLWLRAATIAVPTNIQSGYGALVGVKEMSDGLKKQASCNKWAAVASCVAAAMQAVVVWLNA
jgi:hypothetical protein